MVHKAQKLGKEQEAGKLSIILIPIVLIAIVIVVATLVNVDTSDIEQGLVRVNGELITQSDLDSQWNSLPEQLKVTVSKEDVLADIIRETVLLQEAQALNIRATEEEVQAYIEQQLTQTGISREDFEAALAQQQTSLDDLTQIYQRQLSIAKLFDEVMIDEDFTVPEQDIEAFLNANTQRFTQAEQARVRHILILTEGRNESDVETRIQTIYDAVEADRELFCNYVTNTSEDPGSIPVCGEYTFSRGVMVPGFENASFSMSPGDIEIVESIYGYHIIEKLEDIPEQELGLNDSIQGGQFTVEEVIRGQLEEERALRIFENYVSQLLEASDIKFSENTAIPEEFQ